MLNLCTSWYALFCVRGVIGAFLTITIEETAFLGEYERNWVSKVNKEVQSQDILH